MKEIEIIESPLNGIFIHDGHTVEVFIFREASEDWSLEIVGEEGESVVWADQFETDELAYAEFISAVESEGLDAILSPEDVE